MPPHTRQDVSRSIDPSWVRRPVGIGGSRHRRHQADQLRRPTRPVPPAGTPARSRRPCRRAWGSARCPRRGPGYPKSTRRYMPSAAGVQDSGMVGNRIDAVSPVQVGRHEDHPIRSEGPDNPAGRSILATSATTRSIGELGNWSERHQHRAVQRTHQWPRTTCWHDSTRAATRLPLLALIAQARPTGPLGRYAMATRPLRPPLTRCQESGRGPVRRS
jgi:hypothetical protein